MLDNAAAVAVLALAALVVAYFTYGRFIARRIYRLDPNRRTPAHTQQDGVDFVPTRIPVLFGHHFASIAGAGPIVGPIVGILGAGVLPFSGSGSATLSSVPCMTSWQSCPR